MQLDKFVDEGVVERLADQRGPPIAPSEASGLEHIKITLGQEQ